MRITRIVAMVTTWLVAVAGLGLVTFGLAAPAQAAAADYVPMSPSRLVDTRYGVGLPKAKVTAGSTSQVQVAGRAGIPADAEAVVLNVTSVGSAAGGWLTVFPSGAGMPSSSNVNFVRGQTVANQVIATLGEGGRVAVYSSAPTDVLVDVAGYFPAGSSYEGAVPKRIVDTRSGLGARVGDVPAGGVAKVTIPAPAGVAIGDVEAAVVNVTVRSASTGWATVYPSGAARPTASNVNYVPNRAASGMVIAKLGTGGSIDVYTSAKAMVLVDVSGYLTKAGAYVGLTPYRLVDTRKTTRVKAGSWVNVPVAGKGGVPSTGASAASVNVTIISKASGYATVYPAGAARPTASVVNYAANQATANSSVVKLGSNGAVAVFVSSTSDVIVDVSGWVKEPPKILPVVNSVTPSTGPMAGGTRVEIDGTDFTGTTQVLFGAGAGTNLQLVSDNKIRVTAPAQSRPGTFNVQVRTAAGVSLASNGAKFTYERPAVPEVTSVAPKAGPLAGGATVKIYGKNFSGASRVVFGTKAAQSFTVNSSSEITAVTPWGNQAGPVNVQVTVVDTSAKTSLDQYVYEVPPPPVLTSITPSSGPLRGGTDVVIKGRYLTAANVVTFAGRAGVQATIVSPTEIRAQTPMGDKVGPVDVQVKTPGGTNPLPSPIKFSYLTPPRPVVSEVTPVNGSLAGGTKVTVKGTDLAGATKVTFGGVPATTAPQVLTPDSLSVVTPASSKAGLADVLVTTPGGTSAVSTGAKFTFIPPPSLTSVTPASGPLAGGQTVTIKGSDLGGTTSVKFGGASATNVKVIDSATVTATVPPQQDPGKQTVTLTTPAGSSSGTPVSYTYTVPPPTVTTVAPDEGPLVGGTVVTVTGTNLSSTKSITFGGTAGTELKVVDDTKVTVKTPPGRAAGTVAVSVSTLGGQSPVSPVFTYLVPREPTVTSVTPAKGTLAGGTQVTLRGSGFFAATSTKFAGIPGTSMRVVSDSEIVVTTPLGIAPGVVDVQVTTPGGTSAAATEAKFTYEAPGVPIVAGVSPAVGPTTGGTNVTLTGSSFAGVTAVTFDGEPAKSFRVVSNGTLSVNTPAGEAGPADVVVTGPSGTSQPGVFTYLSLPEVANLSPAAGPVVGGATMTVNGANFLGASQVTVGGNLATDLVVVSASVITVTVPKAPGYRPGTVDVVVTTPAGRSIVSAASKYVYETPELPTITSVDPAEGPMSGGNTVTIKGTNLLSTKKVWFSDGFFRTEADSFAVQSDSQITALADPGWQLEPVDVVVETWGGESEPGPQTKYTYQLPPRPTITSITPNVGPLAGGTSITINGLNLAGAEITIGGVPTPFTRLWDNRVQLSTPPMSTPGIVDVVVKTPGGTTDLTSAATFTYLPVPTVTGVDPGTGPLLGGTTVTVTGTDFASPASVKFGTSGGSSVVVKSATEIQVTTARQSNPGSVPVEVTTPGGKSVVNATFVYENGLPKPVISSVTPGNGPLAGGTTITVQGENLADVTSLTVGGKPVTGLQVDSATRLRGVVPIGAKPGAVPVVATSPSGASAQGPVFTYDTPTVLPVLTSVEPATGPLAGGTTVTLTGTDLAGTTQVTFGGVKASRIVSVADTRLVVIAPMGTEVQSVDILVTTPAGESAATAAARYTYQRPAVPAVTSISPAKGPLGGGVTVRLTGVGLAGATSVKFGDVAGTDIKVSSDSSLTVVAPAGTAAGEVPVVVTTPGGTSVVGLATMFTYE